MLKIVCFYHRMKLQIRSILNLTEEVSFEYHKAALSQIKIEYKSVSKEQ